MNPLSISLPTALLLPLFAFAGSKSFDFKDPKGVNTIIFQMDALLESINGSGAGISGSVEFDPEEPSQTSGVILLDASSLRVDNPVLQEHMHGEEWLNVGQFPSIEFSFSQLSDVKRSGRELSAMAEGKMTIRNTTIKMKVPVKISHLQGMLEKRNKTPGDLLVVRSQFSVSREDFGIRSGEHLDKVANQIDISLNLAGAAPY